MDDKVLPDRQIDDAVVKQYFGGAAGGTAASLSMMAHEHNLPADAVRYRLQGEIRTINDWLDAVDPAGCTLDLGCGAGTWLEVFARRYRRVVGIEQSPMMARDASQRVEVFANAEVMERDVRAELPEGARLTWHSSGDSACICRTLTR